MKKIIVFAILISVMSMPLMAKKIGGKEFQDNLVLNKSKLVLNGGGVISKFFIKVYAVGLYIEQKSSDWNKILKDEKPMAIKMHFIYDGVAKDKIIQAWKDGFDKYEDALQAKLKARLEKLCALFTEEAKENDVYLFEYDPSVGTKIFINKELKGTIEGKDFKQALFGIWLGEDPRDDGVKEEMLGIE
jgi:hypothetical protein